MATRRNPRAGTGRGRELGIDDRNIPGGLEHIGNAETHQHKAPEKARRHIPAMNEHGVADDNPDTPYADPEAGEVLTFEPEDLPREFYAVPVYDAGKPGKTPVHRAALCDNIMVPAPGSDPIQICGRDYGRVEVRILNEDANNDIRFSEDRSALLEGRGALLWHGTNSYTTVDTQDELWALGVSAACLISVVRVTEVNN